jgi:lysophospholipase L1-like esterase
LSAPRFDALVAVGDNLSLDPASAGHGTGAVSLLYRNRDAEWPDFRGRDMVSRDPSIRLLMLAQAGAATPDVLAQQMKRVPRVEEDAVLVTITAGSRDLLAQPDAVDAAEGLYERLTAIFEELGRRVHDSVVLLGNIPNPSEGEPPAALEAFNKSVAEVAREQNAAMVDLHEHLAGHGPGAEDAWLTEDLHPTVQGAHEIRRLFWNALSEF